jgi:hypothetical protein
MLPAPIAELKYLHVHSVVVIAACVEAALTSYHNLYKTPPALVNATSP